MVRPVGAVKIEKTKMIDKNVLVAKLSGAVEGTVAVVRKGEDKFHLVAPASLGGTRRVAADSLTDGLHQAVYLMGEKAEKRQAKERRKKNKRGGRKS